MAPIKLGPRHSALWRPLDLCPEEDPKAPARVTDPCDQLMVWFPAEPNDLFTIVVVTFIYLVCGYVCVDVCAIAHMTHQKTTCVSHMGLEDQTQVAGRLGSKCLYLLSIVTGPALFVGIVGTLQQGS